MEPEHTQAPGESTVDEPTSQQLVLSEFVFGREATPVESDERTERRRRAAERSRARVPYN